MTSCTEKDIIFREVLEGMPSHIEVARILVVVGFLMVLLAASATPRSRGAPEGAPAHGEHGPPRPRAPAVPTDPFRPTAHFCLEAEVSERCRKTSIPQAHVVASEMAMKG